jgi:putative hydrolase of the HAD superfamily
LTSSSQPAERPGQAPGQAIQAVIFDLDDTLYPERAYVLSGFQAVAAWLEGRLTLPEGQAFAELQELFEAGVRGDTFNRWLAGHNLPADGPRGLLAGMIQAYRSHDPVLVPYPEVPALLARLINARCRLGLVSDGYLDVQQRKLAALGLAGCFQAIVFSDQWGRDAWKPSPRPFLAALEQLAVEVRAAAYVADNPLKDFLGARQLGMYTVRVRRAGGEYASREPASEAYAPHKTIDNLAGLLPALDLRA